MKTSPRKLATLLLSLVLLAGGWWLLGPVQLGGPTGFAIVNGNSMEPRLERGDLVLVRKRDSYDVGDVVLYEAHTGNLRVLHRIVSVQNGHFSTKGDNNDFVDPIHPARGDVLGQLWISVPGAGKAIIWAKQPVNLAILLVLLTFVGVAGGREAKRRRRPGARPVVALPDTVARGTGASAAIPTGSALAVAGGVALVLFGCLAFVAFAAKGTTTRTVEALYANEGAFSYRAETTPGPVYPTGTVTTADPVFTRLVDTLDVAFHYRLSTDAPADVHGTIALDAVVSDTTGWTRIFPLAQRRAFRGSTATTAGAFDVRAFEDLVLQAREETAAPFASITVTLRPAVDVAGSVGATTVDGSFDPKLTFSYDGTTLRPVPAPNADPGSLPPFRPSVSESGEEVVTTPLALGPLSLPVADARTLSSLGIGVSLAALLLAGALLARPTRGRGPAERISSRYGNRIVAARAIIPPERWVTEIDDMDALVRIADTYERVILHVVEGGEDVYLVDDGVAVYRHRPLAVPAAVGGLPSTASW
ncbi:MAG TPA: signal peptidase I [Gaiella sp.]